MGIVAWENVTAMTGAGLSALALARPLAENALMLDSMTRRGRRAWTDQIDELSNNGFNPSPLMRGAFVFRPGVTTLTLIVFGTAHTLRVRLNGTQVATLTLTNTTQTVTVSLTGSGFTDGQIVEVDCDVERPGGTDPGTYAVRDAYVSPMSGIVGSSYGGTPTFGALSEASLQQLANAQIWLLDRLNLQPWPVPQGFYYRTLHNWPSTRLAWRGSIARANGANRLVGVIAYANTNTPSERLRLLLDSGGGYAEVATTPTITAGQSGVYEFAVDLSGYTNEARLLARLEQIVTAEYPFEHGAVSTRWNLRWMETSNTAWSYPGLAASALPMEDLTFSQLQSRLNAIATQTQGAYSRITGAPELWDRQRLFRRSPTVDEFQRGYHRRTFVARSIRSTDALLVRGKGVTLCWGPHTIPQESETPWREWTAQWEEQLIGGDTYETKLISFDMFAGLPAGTYYTLVADDLVYAGELWR